MKTPKAKSNIFLSIPQLPIHSGAENQTLSHAGCDLICPIGTPVFAVADGTFVQHSPFYLQTFFVEINHGSFTARYGEVQPDKNKIPKSQIPPDLPSDDICKGIPDTIKLNKRVKKGDCIGWVGELRGLDRNGNFESKGHMLHFEMYSNHSNGPLTVLGGKGYLTVPEGPYERRKDLLNPTKYLDEASDV